MIEIRTITLDFRSSICAFTLNVNFNFPSWLLEWNQLSAKKCCFIFYLRVFYGGLYSESTAIEFL